MARHSAAAKVVSFPTVFPAQNLARRGDWLEEVELTDIADACKFAQRELFACKLPFGMIARSAGVNHATVARIAYGETQSPRLVTVLKILHVLGFSVVARR